MKTLILFGSLLASQAFATPCESTNPMPTGPLNIGLLNSDLGRAHRICPTTEVATSLGGLLVADTPNFYGHIVGNLNIEGSYGFSSGTEIYGSLEVFRYESVISALSSSNMGLGHLSLGASQVLFKASSWTLGIHGKMVLPTATGLYDTSWPIGGDLGLGLMWSPKEWVHVRTHLSGLLSGNISNGNPFTRIGGTHSLGADFFVLPWLGLTLETHAGFGYNAALDFFAIAPGLRFAGKEKFGAELSGIVPLAGRERALADVTLRFSWRL